MKMKKWQASVLVCTSLVCLSACKNQTTSEADKQNGDKNAAAAVEKIEKGVNDIILSNLQVKINYEKAI